MTARLRRYLSGSGLGPTLVKAVSGSAGLRLTGMGFGFLVGVQLARGLGAEGYGVYGVAMSVIALLTVPTEFGFPQLLTREVAAALVRGEWGRMKGVLRLCTRSSMLIAAAIAACVVGWLLISGQGLGSAFGMTLLVGVAMVPVVALVSLRSAALRGLQHIVKGQLPDTLLRPALHSLLLFVATTLSLTLTPTLAMGFGALSAGMALVVATLLLRRSMPETAVTAAPIVDARRLYSEALPMALTEGMRILQGHLVILLLSFMSTMALVGMYRVASSIMLLVAFPLTLFNVVGAPVISRLYAEEDHRRLQLLLTRLAMGMLGGTALLTLPFLFFGERLLGGVFGEEFAGASVVLLILCAGNVANAALGANAALLNMTGHPSRVTRASILALLSLALSAPVLIVLCGIEGAAAGSVLALTVWNVLMWRDALRLLSLDTSIFSRFQERETH